jgi:hypothetical protein
MKKNFVNLFKIKSLIVDYARQRMNKAVEMGVVDFNLFEGITFEDIKISNESDFSSNKIFFTTQRVDIIPNSIFSKNISLEKIIFHNSKLYLIENEFSVLNLIEYLEETGLPSIEFRDLSIQIKKETEIVWKTKKPINIQFLKKKDIFYIDVKDSFFSNSFFRSLEGKGSLDTKNREINLSIQLKNYPLSIMPGSVKSISYFHPDSGYTDGFIRIHQTTKDTSIEGNFDLFDLNGKNTLFNSLSVESIPINCKLSYFKETSEKNETDIYFQRKINNPDFYYNENIHEDKDKSSKIIISALFQNLSNLSRYLELEESTELKGIVKIDLIALKSEKSKDFVLADGLIHIADLDWKFANPNLHLQLDKTSIAINQKGNLGISSSGKILGQDFDSQLEGQIKFEKPVVEGMSFVTNSSIKTEMNFKTVYLEKFKEIYAYIRNKISEDIKERQEKMLPESYIIKNLYYIQFLDKLKLDLKLNADQVHFQSNGEKIGAGKMNVKFSKGTLEMDTLISDSSGDKKFSSSLRGFIDKKSPYFDFRIKMNRFPLEIPIIEYCNYDLIPKYVVLDASVLSTGNNFSDLMVSKNFNLEYEFLDSKLIARENQQNESFQDSFPLEINSLKGGWSGYGPESYFRNIEIVGSGQSLKGFGNTTKNGLEVFNFWGTKNDKSYSLNLTTKNEEKKCQISKK